MKIQELFDHLSAGEFSQLSINGAGQSVISEANHNRVVSFIQLGLTALYKRFNLKERRISFGLVEGSDTYQVQAADLLRIERVITDGDTELSLNDYNDAYGCFTPQLNTVRVSPKLLAQAPDTPECYRTEELTVVYRADHPKILGSSGILIPETKTIEVPPTHVEALLYFVAARVHGNTGQSGEATIGNPWFARYEAECRRLEDGGYNTQVQEQDNRFRSRGWV